MSYKIVVLDGGYANPGDQSWDSLHELGETIIYDQTKPDEVIRRSFGAEILIINKIKLGDEQFDQLPTLKLIVISATGMDNVDLGAAKNRGIEVQNTRDYSTESVAQHTFALILTLTNQVYRHHETVVNGDWTPQRGFSYVLHSVPELSELNLGIYGFGAIGQAVARIGTAFGMTVSVFSNHANPSDYPQFRFVNEEALFKQCDIVSLHCPLTERNRHFVNKRLLSLMKPTARLVNTARGALVNEEDLHWALSNQLIAGAGLDVLGLEPPPTSHPLFKLDNCIITPHMAWTSLRSRNELIRKVVNHVRNFINGS